jgi:glutamate synthase (NADPH/NADH) small chain
MLMIQEQAGRCLQCKKPRCQGGCPIQTPIPQAIALFKDGQLLEAAQMLFENNPLSLICSIVCDHSRQCQGNCVKGIKSSPVEWGEIEHFISDTYFERVKLAQKPSTNKSVAIIGSGPAGMASALFLRAMGHEVTIYESQPEIGGMLRYGIPEFRLPKSILKRYEKKMRELGISLRLHTSIGSSIEIADLLRDGFDTVLIASGLWRASKLNIPGEALPNVCYGIHYLSAPESFQIGERLAIIGTGNTAIDVARTALHHGVSYVTLYARRTQSKADPKEMEMARLEGAKFQTQMQIVRIEKEGPVFHQVHLDENGNIDHIDEKELLEPADFTIIAASQGPKSKLIHTTDGLEGTERGLLKTDEFGHTTVEGIFGAGDVVYGGKTVVEAVANAKKVCQSIDTYLKGLQ